MRDEEWEEYVTKNGQEWDLRPGDLVCEASDLQMPAAARADVIDALRDLGLPLPDFGQLTPSTPVYSPPPPPLTSIQQSSSIPQPPASNIQQSSSTQQSSSVQQSKMSSTPVPLASGPQKCGSVVETYIRTYNGSTSYDITNNKTLTYSAIRNLCLALARESLNSSEVRSPDEIRMEKARRNELMSEIYRYRACKFIGAAYDEDCTNMSITELENYLKNIKHYHDELKVREVLSGACAIFGQGYSSIFPNGIPITKTKAIKFDGLSEDILNTLLSPTTTTGISFANLLSKYDIKITDELCSLTAILKSIISTCKIVDIPQTDESTK